ncbi:MAG: FAD:protein FMN transferase [Polaribacter sp.]|uniref:FAD:protein FMN transferase n=1 Tax=Polaribacter sp. TaxID=1920175 RepID=UPI00384C262E
MQDYNLNGAIFGTTYKIIYLNGSSNYQKSIDSLFLKMNTSLSTYIPTSAISKINNGAKTLVIDDFFAEVFKKSKRIFEETDGFFDPTVGNLVNAWGFGPKNEKFDLTPAQVARQMQFVGFDKVQYVDGRIVKTHPEIYLDFNSIAKGYGIDVVARFLESKNITSYLVEIGGEIRTNGFKDLQQPWTIKLVDPIASEFNSGYKKLNLSNKSMATSGNYRKFRVTASGRKYVHTINPKTGGAKESTLLSVSVIAAMDCADVDAYATAFMAMGLERTKIFLEKAPKLEVILLYANAQGILEEYTNYNGN